MKLERIYSIIEGVGILKEVSFTFDVAKFYYVIVESENLGTYLFDCLGLARPIMEGKFIINGEDVSGYSYKDKAKIRRENIGFIFKNILLDEDFNVFDNIMLPLVNEKNLSKLEKIKRVNDLLKEYNMEKYKDKYSKDLTLFEKQKVSLIRALVNKPKFVIAHEPTELFREEEEKEFIDLLKALKMKGIGVIIVTRRVKFPKIADEILEYDNKFM